MLSSRLNRAILCAVALCMTGCFPQLESGWVVSRKPAIELPSGAPRSSCEEAEWLELAPAVVRGQGSSSRGGIIGGETWTATRSERGRAVFSLGMESGLSAHELAEELDDNAVVEERLRELRGVERQRTVAQVLMGSGMALTLGGLIALFPYLDRRFDSATGPGYDGSTSPLGYLIYGTMIAGAVIMPLGLIVQPSPQKRAQYAIRTKLYTADDDLEALADGVSRHNKRVRAECGSEKPGGTFVSREGPAPEKFAAIFAHSSPSANPFLDFTLLAPTLDAPATHAPATHRDERAGERLGR